MNISDTFWLQFIFFIFVQYELFVDYQDTMGDETKTGGLALVSDLESFTGKGLTELKGTPLKKNFL